MNNITKSHLEKFFESDLPKNTAVESQILAVGGMLGGLEIMAEKMSDITLTGNLKIELLGSDKRDGNFEVFKTFEMDKTAIDKDASGLFLAYTLGTKDPVFVKTKISTTDASAVGKISVFVHLNA